MIIEKKKRYDMIPNHILQQIFQYLTIEDLKTVNLVCQQWYENSNFILWAEFRGKASNKTEHKSLINLLKKHGNKIKYHYLSIPRKEFDIEFPFNPFYSSSIYERPLRIKEIVELCPNLTKIEIAISSLDQILDLSLLFTNNKLAIKELILDFGNLNKYLTEHFTFYDENIQKLTVYFNNSLVQLRGELDFIYLPNLQELNLNCDVYQSSLLSEIKGYLPELTKLSINATQYLTNENKKNSKKLEKLSEIELNITNLKEECVFGILEDLCEINNLRTLNYNNDNSLGLVINNFPTLFTNLTQLILTKTVQIHRPCFLHLQNLNILKIHSLTKLRYPFLPLILGLTNLQVLAIDSSLSDDDFITKPINCVKLKEFYFGNIKEYGENFLNWLCSQRELRYFEILKASRKNSSIKFEIIYNPKFNNLLSVNLGRVESLFIEWIERCSPNLIFNVHT